MKRRVPVYMSLGSNIDPAHNLPAAVALLRKELNVEAIASTWETPPFGTSGANFYNTAIKVTTDLSLEDLKNNILRPIEARMGRIRTADKYAPRPIDLDIIIYNDQLIEPRLWALPFLAIPLSQLLPEYVNLETGQTLDEVARHMLPESQVSLRPEVVYETQDSRG